MTSASSAAVVTLTNRNAGAALDIDVRLNYQPDETLPPGVALTIAAGTTGATDPDIQDALDAVDDERFNVIAHPYNAAASMVALEAELTDRWGPTQQLDGVALTAFRGTVAAGHDLRQRAQQPVFERHGNLARRPRRSWHGRRPSRGRSPNRPRPTRRCPSRPCPCAASSAPPTARASTTPEREVLLSDGIATHRVDRTGIVSIERMVSTYQTAAGGVPDNAFRDINTAFTVSYIRARFRQRFGTKFRRYKLANDGTRYGPGQRVVTPGGRPRRGHRALSRDGDRRHRGERRRLQDGAGGRAQHDRRPTASTSCSRPTW